MNNKILLSSIPDFARLFSIVGFVELYENNNEFTSAVALNSDDFGYQIKEMKIVKDFDGNSDIEFFDIDNTKRYLRDFKSIRALSLDGEVVDELIIDVDLNY